MFNTLMDLMVYPKHSETWLLFDNVSLALPTRYATRYYVTYSSEFHVLGYLLGAVEERGVTSFPLSILLRIDNGLIAT